MRLGSAVLLVIAVAAVVFFIATRGGDDSAHAVTQPDTDKDTGTGTLQTVSSAGPPDARTTALVRRLADAQDRARVMAAIAAARARRTGTTATAPPAATTPRGPAPSLDAPPPMSKDDIRAAVKEVVPLLQECYEQAIPRLAKPYGQIKVTLHVVGEPDVGSLIDTADLAGDRALLGDHDFSECLHETMMSVELPALPEGGEVQITYPMIFQDADGSW